MRRSVAAIAVALLATGGAFVAMSAGDSPSRRELVAERGSRVMPFDLDRTTHVFTPSRDGGVQRVVADDAGDAEQVRLIRAHLREEARAFSRGDFGDPATIHGDEMPGLATLRERYGSIGIRYRDLVAGAELRYTTRDPLARQALADWFGAQLSDHGRHARTR